MGLTIGVDIGGTKIAAGVVDEEGTILETVKVPTPPTPEGVVDAIAAAVRDARTAHRGLWGTCGGPDVPLDPAPSGERGG